MDSVLSNEVARRIAADLTTLVSEAEKHGTLPRIKSVAIYFNETELRTIIKLLRSCHGILDPAQTVWMPIATAPKGPTISVARKGGQRDDGSTYWYQAIGHYDPNLGHFHKSYGELYGEPEVWAQYPENPERCAARGEIADTRAHAGSSAEQHEEATLQICFDKVAKERDQLRAQIKELSKSTERYMRAVAALGKDSGYNKLTYFEAPILNMPTEEMKTEAHNRWLELNDAGIALTLALQPEGGK